ncbi:hypothetical protein QNH20_04295 [Neobacillus sp. WH10]|uniref:hypothetical protein n=1 Tax=Neobacillus sp. WH10 TaxID=3047873 RepID=UPI0024C10772|nr:hypothetical protein [Neobacillus sp. WH10]WHY78377.1 hypothetical protein QNH20_04295 [Neobacillus sp. WH10]
MYPAMEDLLSLLKSTNLADRKKAIDELQNWNYQLEMDDAITLLEEAGQIWPISDEDWDDPSLALVKAACVFIHEDMIPVFEKNLIKYSYQAINLVLSGLIIHNSESAKLLYKKTFRQLYFQAPFIPNYEERNLIFEQKDSTLTAIEVLVENEIYLHPWYEWYYHFLVSMGLEHQYFTIEEIPLDREFITEKLQFFIDQYLEFDKEYTREYVYEAWKLPYFQLRFYIKNYLTIYSALCMDEQLLELQTILNWKDDQLKLYFIEILWNRKLNNDDVTKTIQEILIGQDGAQEAFRIIKKYQPELVPTDASFQKYFLTEAAAFTFYNSPNGVEMFPDEVEIMGSFEEKDAIYGDSLTYYVIRFKSNDPAFVHKGWMRMLLGAYYTANIPTTMHPVGLDDGFTDFMPWREKSYEAHVENFRAHIAEKHGTNEKDEVFYQSAPKYKRRNNTIAILSFVLFLALIQVNDWFIFGLILPPVWLLLNYLHAKKLEKNILVQIRGYYLDYYCFDGGTYVSLNDIAKISIEKRTIAKPERFLHLPLKTWHYIFYDYGDQEIYSIPSRYLLEEYFIPILKTRTVHLSKPPVLAWEMNKPS